MEYKKMREYTNVINLRKLRDRDLYFYLFLI